MEESDWKRSEARALMIDHLKHGTPLPDVLIDSVLNTFFARVGSCLLTRSEILIQGEHARDERKDQCREAYKRIQRAMKEHAQRIGMGRHANKPTETPAIHGDGTRGTNRERDRKNDRRSGFNFEHDSTHAAGVSRVRDEKHDANVTPGNVSTRTRQRKRSGDNADTRRDRAARTTVQHSAKNALKKASGKRSTVAPRKAKQR